MCIQSRKFKYFDVQCYGAKSHGYKEKSIAQPEMFRRKLPQYSWNRDILSFSFLRFSKILLVVL